MKNKIFSVWFRELCTLVFVQSMQALLMVVMLSVVAKLYLGNGDSYGAKQSTGIYAVFVLAMIPKVELLVKKIFGMGSGVMDESMMGGKKSLLKTGLALRLGSSVLNNAGKVIGGVGMMAGASLSGLRQSRISKNNKETADINDKTQKKKLELRNNFSGTNPLSLGDGTNNESLQGGVGGYSLDDLTSAIKSANAPDPIEKMKERKHENWQRGLKGLQQATSGVVESLGAVTGATAGGIVALGTGGDDILNDMLIGAGIGDKAGRLATDLTLGNVVAANELGYQYGVGRRQVQKSKADKKKAQDEYDKLIREASSQSRKVSPAKVVQPPETATIKNKRTISGAKTITTAPKSSNNKNVTQLTSEQKKVYEKAKAAKKAGNMDEYHKNMNIAAGMMKQQKITENKSSESKQSLKSNDKSTGRTKSYTPTTPNSGSTNNNANSNKINDIGNI